MSSEPGKWIVGSVYLVMGIFFAIISLKAISDTGNLVYTAFLVPSALLTYAIIDDQLLRNRRLHKN